jgi:hypothetical protein
MSNKHIISKVYELLFIFHKIDKQKAIVKSIFNNSEFIKVLIFNYISSKIYYGAA